MSVNRRLRYEILRRDNHACRYCGATAPGAKLVVDHVTPTALGGTDTPDNLVTACEPCNSGKSSMPADAALVSDVRQDAVRWSIAWKQAAQNVGHESALKAKAAAKVKNRLVRLCKESYGRTPTLPSDAQASIVRWLELGLPVEKIAELAEYTVSRRNVLLDGKWRYFSGCCWGAVKDIEARTRAILNAASPQADTPTELDAVGNAALALWVANWAADYGDEPDPGQVERLRSELATFRGSETGQLVEPERLIRAVSRSAELGDTATIDEMLESLSREERFEAVIDWADAWARATGEATPNSLYAAVDGQIKALVNHGVSLGRAAQAAIVAGSRGSSILHFGLRPGELKAVDTDGVRNQILDAWTTAFTAAGCQPLPAQRATFLRSLDAIAEAGGYLVTDGVAAAGAAGAYQDPDLATCLTRRMSVFEAAAQPFPFPLN